MGRRREKRESHATSFLFCNNRLMRTLLRVRGLYERNQIEGKIKKAEMEKKEITHTIITKYQNDGVPKLPINDGGEFVDVDTVCFPL